MSLLKKIVFALSLLFMHQSIFSQKTNKRISYLDKINTVEDFNALQSTPLSEKYNNVKALKIIYEIATDKIYFIESKKYRFHYDFVHEYLDGYEDLYVFNNTEYGRNKDRKYLLCNLNYFSASNLYIIDFFADDEFDKTVYDAFYKKIYENVYFTNKLSVLPNQWMKKWEEKTSFISEADIYSKQQYQVLVKGETYGYLKIVPKGKFNPEDISSTNIIITENMPLQLPIMQGMITSVFQTPLSHVNILCQARGIPNCALTNIFKNEVLKKLEGKLVKMVVLFDTVIISLAKPGFDAKQYFLRSQKKSNNKILDLDTTSNTNLVDINRLGKKDIAMVGGKAAHMGELYKITANGAKLPLPENAFAIPLRYYFEHIIKNNIFLEIDSLINNEKITQDKILLKIALEKIRKQIEVAPVSTTLLALVKKKLMRDTTFKNYRFRSSTNAEDIEGFSGAGLYDSKTGTIYGNKKPIDEAIKKVWASLWNEAAFVERERANIYQGSVGMGILVHRAFGTEEANGVAVTKNLYRSIFDGMTINVQVGEVSVSNPADSITCEQIIVKNTWQLKQSGGVGIEYISYSPLNNYNPILTKEEIDTLWLYLYKIKLHFFNLYGYKKSVLFDDFAVDVEFKLNKGDRKIYIKQARLY